MGNLRRRLEKLEEGARPERRLADWPLEDQMEDVLSALQVHRWGGTKQLATDRQIRLMGILCAMRELDGDSGEYRFPSGLTVTLTPDENSDSGLRVDAPRPIRVEDLPEDVGRYFERMDPADQPERERWLHETWRRRKEQREEAARFIEAGEEADRRWKLRKQDQEERSS